MDLDTLRTFLQVIETKSLVAASKRLHVTQSTVTARLNALERAVGQRLLHRGKAGAELTSAGFKFQRYAEVMLQLWRQAQDEVSPPQGMDGTCNIGMEFDVWRGIGQRFVDGLQGGSARVAVAVWPGEQPQLDRWLNIGLIDIAFCFAPPAGAGLTRRLLIDDAIVLVASARASRPQLDASYVFVDHGEEFRRQHAAAFPAGTGSAITIASSEWALEHLLAHGGSGYLSLRHARPLLAQRRLHRVANAPTFTRSIYLVGKSQTIAEWPWFDAAVAAVANLGRRRR